MTGWDPVFKWSDELGGCLFVIRCHRLVSLAQHMHSLRVGAVICLSALCFGVFLLATRYPLGHCV
jgi:hypothetical protein